MTEEDVREFCKGKIAHQDPAIRAIRRLVPMTVTGETQKYMARQREIELRGLDAVAHIQTA